MSGDHNQYQKPEGCAGCGKKQSDGWALYCVKCIDTIQEPIGWIYEDDEGRMIFTQMPHPDPLWEPVYRAAPKRNFKFSTIEEAKQPTPAPTGRPQLTDDETRFADAFTALIKAGYGKEAETVLKLGKLKEKNG